MPAATHVVQLAILILLAVWFTLKSWRSMCRNCFGMIAGGMTIPAEITDIGATARNGACRLRFRYQRGSGGRSSTGRQTTTATAVRRAGLIVGSIAEARYLPKWPSCAFLPILILEERIQSAANDVMSQRTGLREAPALVYVNFMTANVKRWTGPGDLLIGQNSVLFTAEKRRPFWSPTRIQLRVPIDCIGNVERAARTIRLEIAEHDRRAWTVQFDVATEQDAKLVERLLPKNRTGTFVPVLTDQSAFNARLLEVSPHARVTPSLITVNVLVFGIASLMGGGFLVANPEAMIQLGSDYTPLTEGGQWWRLFTSIFLHFGVIHLTLNMSALYLNGIFAERIFGSRRYLVIYLVSGVGGSVASLLWHPVVNGAGASGAIFGIFGALIAFFLRKEGGVPASVVKSQLRTISIFVLYNLIYAARSRGVDNAAHLGGLAAGLVMGFVLSRPLLAGREERDWPLQWAGTLGVVFGGSILFAYLWRTGVLQRRLATPVLPQTVREFGGVTLGSTRNEVLARKGEPLSRPFGEWTYNVIDNRHDALLVVYFHDEAKGDQRHVSMVTFVGHDKSAAPGELPYLNASTLDQVAGLFGQPFATRQVGSGSSFCWYTNGVFVAAQGGKVTEYGIFRVEKNESR